MPEGVGRRSVWERPGAVVYAFLLPKASWRWLACGGSQTKVSMSLIYDLFQLFEKDSPQKTCHQIAELLNSTSSSPFYNKLKMLGNVEKNKAGTLPTLSQASFINYFIPLITKDKDRDLRMLKSLKERTFS